MPGKLHLYYRGEQLLEGHFSYRSRYNPNNDDEDNPDPDYRPMQDVFRKSLASFLDYYSTLHVPFGFMY